MIKVTKRGVNIKNIAVLFIVIFALCFIPNANNIFAQEPNSGNLCEGAISWNLTEGVLTVEGSGVLNGYNSLPWKNYKESITSISFKGNSETEKISFSDIHKYFYEYTALESVTFENIDTSESKAFYGLFDGCKELTSVDLSMFDFSRNTDVHGFSEMFKGCVKLVSIKMPDTMYSTITNIYRICYDCNVLESIDLSCIDFSEITEMKEAFFNCNAITDITLIDGNSDVINDNELSFINLFNSCNLLENINGLEHFKCKVKSMENAFVDTNALTSIDLSSFDLSECTSFKNVANGCDNLETVIIADQDVTIENSVNFETAFYNSVNLKNIEGLGHLNCKVSTMMLSFSQCAKLQELDLSGFDLSGCTSLLQAFFKCSNLNEIIFNENECTNTNSLDLSQLFYNCEKLKEVKNFNKLHLKASSIENIFSGCKEIKEIDISNIDTSGATSVMSAFGYCDNVETITLGAIKVPKLSNEKDFLLKELMCPDTIIISNGAQFTDNEHYNNFKAYDSDGKRISSLKNKYTKDTVLTTHIYTSIDGYKYYTNKVVDNEGKLSTDIKLKSNLQIYGEGSSSWYYSYLYTDGTAVLVGVYKDGYSNKKFTKIGSWEDSQQHDVSGNIKQIVISKLGFSPTNLDYYFSGLNNSDGVLIDLRELDLTHMEKNTIDHPYDQSNIKQVLMPLNIPDGFIFPMPEDKTWYLYDKNGKLVGEDIENLVAGDGYYALTEKIVTPTPSHKRKKKTNDEVKEESKEETKDSSLINEVKDLIDTSKVAYMTGFSDNTFRPNDYITRAEVSKVISLIKDMFVKNDSDVNYVDNYTDLDNDAWYASYVNDVIASNLMTGDDNGNFNPNSEITRGEIFKIICDLLGISNDEYIPINSMELDGMWYEKYVCLLLNNKLLKGYGDGMFRPSNKITRIELAILINRIQNRMIDNYNDNTLTFSDIDSDYIYYDEIVKASKVIE